MTYLTTLSPETLYDLIGAAALMLFAIVIMITYLACESTGERRTPSRRRATQRRARRGQK